MNKGKSHEQGKWMAITLLNQEKKKIGWSPKLKKSVFIDEKTDPETVQELKRIRESPILTVYDQSADRTLFLELTNTECGQFDEIYSRYLEVGGQILYSRKKEGRKTSISFMLDEEYRKIPESDVEKRSLFNNI